MVDDGETRKASSMNAIAGQNRINNFLKKKYLAIFRVFGRGKPTEWVGTGVMLIVVLLIIVLHVVFLFTVIAFGLISVAQKYGVYLFVFSMVFFSSFFFLLTSRIKAILAASEQHE